MPGDGLDPVGQARRGALLRGRPTGRVADPPAALCSKCEEIGSSSRELCFFLGFRPSTGSGCLQTRPGRRETSRPPPVEAGQGHGQGRCARGLLVRRRLERRVHVTPSSTTRSHVRHPPPSPTHHTRTAQSFQRLNPSPPTNCPPLSSRLFPLSPLFSSPLAPLFFDSSILPPTPPSMYTQAY